MNWGESLLGEIREAFNAAHQELAERDGIPGGKPVRTIVARGGGRIGSRPVDEPLRPTLARVVMW